VSCEFAERDLRFGELLEWNLDLPGRLTKFDAVFCGALEQRLPQSGLRVDVDALHDEPTPVVDTERPAASPDPDRVDWLRLMPFLGMHPACPGVFWTEGTVANSGGGQRRFDLAGGNAIFSRVYDDSRTGPNGSLRRISIARVQRTAANTFTAMPVRSWDQDLNISLSGTVKKLTGQVKEAAGIVTGDKKLEQKGAKQRAQGELEQNIGKLRRKAGELADTVADAIKE